MSYGLAKTRIARDRTDDTEAVLAGWKWTACTYCGGSGDEWIPTIDPTTGAKNQMIRVCVPCGGQGGKYVEPPPKVVSRG